MRVDDKRVLSKNKDGKLEDKAINVAVNETPEDEASRAFAAWQEAVRLVAYAKKHLSELQEAEKTAKLAVVRCLVGAEELPFGRTAEVLEKLKLGLSNKQIGEELHIATRTVKLHVSNLLKKFNVKNRHDLIKLL